MNFECDIEHGCKDTDVRITFYFPMNEPFSEKYKELLEQLFNAFNTEFKDAQIFKAEITSDKGTFVVEGPLIQFELLIFTALLCAACGTSPVKEWSNKPRKIITYTLPTCPYCAMLARDFLTLAVANGVPVTVKMLDESSPYDAAPTTEIYFDEDNPREIVRGYNMEKLLTIVGGKEE